MDWTVCNHIISQLGEDDLLALDENLAAEEENLFWGSDAPAHQEEQRNFRRHST
ncbi:MAG: hypothetical protein SGPRY_010647 [Prymnesium sp.]